MLVVIGIIALLGTVIISSAKYVIQLSRTQRFKATCRTLETAMARYRSEYNKWPMGTAKRLSNDPKKANYFKFRVQGADNGSVFAMMIEDNRGDNPKGIRFFDETSLMTVDSHTRLPLSSALRQSAGKKWPLVYIDPREGVSRYYTVTFDTDADSVSVTKDPDDEN